VEITHPAQMNFLISSKGIREQFSHSSAMPSNFELLEILESEAQLLTVIPVTVIPVTVIQTKTMVQTTEKTLSSTSSLEEEKAELTRKIRKLNSKAGQMKMDLHDIAEGLPSDLEKLPEAAEKTYSIFCKLRDLKQQLKALE